MSKNILLIFLKKITFAKVINFIKVYISYLISSIFKIPFRWAMPISISVEPTTNCNLKCPHCPVGNGKISRKKGSIDFLFFKKIINQSDKTLLNLFLYFQGEPFLCNDFFKMIKYAVSKKIFTVSSTNGHFLSKKNAQKCVKSGLDKLIISLDATTQDIYEKYRINGNINTVKTGIKNILEAKKKFKSKKPFVEIQFLVLKTNEHQIKKMKEIYKNSDIDKLRFKSAQIYNFKKDKKFISNNKKYSRYIIKNNERVLKKKLKNRCFRLWNSVVITWDGKVLPCCFDKNAKYSFGDANEQNLKKLINNKKFKYFAKKLLTNRKQIDICRNCTE